MMNVAGAKPAPDFADLQPVTQPMINLLSHSNIEVRLNAAWFLSYVIQSATSESDVEESIIS